MKDNICKNSHIQYETERKLILVLFNMCNPYNLILFPMSQFINLKEVDMLVLTLINLQSYCDNTI